MMFYDILFGETGDSDESGDSGEIGDSCKSGDSGKFEILVIMVNLEKVDSE